MATRPTVTVALAAFDRHVPLFLGQIANPAQFEVEWLDVGMTAPGRHGLQRHARMLKDAEFDAAEVSLASYIMARERGAALTAVPVFPRRLFTPPCLHLRHDSPITHPSELAGRKVAIRAFQVTLSVQAKGDLAKHYGLPWRDVHWFTREPETIQWSAGEGVLIEPVPTGKTVSDLLQAGILDAMIDPFPPPELTADGIIRPFFTNPIAESAALLAKTSYFPIMHVMALRNSSIERFPDLGRYLIDAWEEAKAITARLYNDPAYSLLPVLHPVIADQKRLFGADPWPSGLSANEANLRDFLDYMVDQGLIGQAPELSDLFHSSVF